jgi:hypothetical protein
MPKLQPNLSITRPPFRAKTSLNKSIDSMHFLMAYA